MCAKLPSTSRIEQSRASPFYSQFALAALFPSLSSSSSSLPRLHLSLLTLIVSLLSHSLASPRVSGWQKRRGGFHNASTRGLSWKGSHSSGQRGTMWSEESDHSRGKGIHHLARVGMGKGMISLHPSKSRSRFRISCIPRCKKRLSSTFPSIWPNF